MLEVKNVRCGYDNNEIIKGVALMLNQEVTYV